MTSRKFLFRPMCSNGLICSVLALKPLKVIAIIKVANSADFKYVTSTSPNRFRTAGTKRIDRQMPVIYRAPIRISVIIFLVMMLSFLGIGRSFIYSSSAGSLPNAIAARVSMARLIMSSWVTVKIVFSPSRGPIKQVRTAATLTVSWKIRNLRMLLNMVRP